MNSTFGNRRLKRGKRRRRTGMYAMAVPETHDGVHNLMLRARRVPACEVDPEIRTGG